MHQTSLKDRLMISALPVEERENGRRFLSALSLIEGKLQRVEELLLLRTRSDIATIAKIGDYLVEGGGKRIRPALLLLSSHLLGYQGERDVRYAAVIEFIHTATLVHDDIIDDAEIRRGRASVNRRWGNELTVLFGDYLYMRSMEIALEEGDLRVLRLLSDVTLEMTEGEILASESRGSVDIDLGAYLDIVRRKTALLFAAACRIPSFLVEADRHARALWDFGLALGIAFQLQDDLLDYTASEKELGKPVLSDAREGKLTLPLLLSLPRATPAEKKLIQSMLRDRTVSGVEQVLEVVHRVGALDRAHEMVDEYADRARAIALDLPESPARDGLVLASEYAAHRRK